MRSHKSQELLVIVQRLELLKEALSSMQNRILKIVREKNLIDELDYEYYGKDLDENY